jgi:hypothetical protein
MALAPAIAAAQDRAAVPMPLAVDLAKAKLGSWAEYALPAGGPMARVRWALVARTTDGATLEMSMEGSSSAAPGAAASKVVLRTTLAPGAPARGGAAAVTRRLVLQAGDDDPVEMPARLPSAQNRFASPDPKKLIGKETITVKAGTFATSHYRDAGRRGVLDMWVSESVPPLGLVRLTLTPAAGAKDAAGRASPVLTTELVARGSGATAVVVKAARPFTRAMLGARRAGAARPPGSPPVSTPVTAPLAAPRVPVSSPPAEKAK